MKLKLGTDNLQVNFEFFIPDKKISSINPVLAEKIGYNFEQIGIYLSGGLDSAALLCLILAELREKNALNDILVTCIIVDKNEGQVKHAINVIKEVEKIFNISLEYKIFKNKIDKSTIPGRIGNQTYKEITNSILNCIFYQGINNAPSSNIRVFNHVFKGYGNLNKNGFINKKKHCYPFLDLHKPQIIDIFYKLDCETVIKYTQSCIKKDLGKCNNCYWCEERDWGFQALNKTDPQSIS